MAQIEIKNLTFSYPDQAISALDSVSLSIDEGNFVLLYGPSGGGKSTLLRHLKKELWPHGIREGDVLYNSASIAGDGGPGASEIGFVFQNPDNQIVCDKVWHELAFGPENMRLATSVIRRRVAEMASFFGMSDWFHKDVNTLSGGQKQILNLASVMVMQPKILLLDEPTAQLDPIAASDFISEIYKLNRDMGITIVISEHRLEEIFPICDKAVAIDKGKILHAIPPRELAQEVAENPKKYGQIFPGLPTPVKVYVKSLQNANSMEINAPCPLTQREGRLWLSQNFTKKKLTAKTDGFTKNNQTAAIEMKNVWFRYNRNSKDILRGMDLLANTSEITCIIGANGSGKTTMLNTAAGLYRPYDGSIRVFGKNITKYGDELYQGIIASLPQDPSILFTEETVEKEFRLTLLQTIKKDETHLNKLISDMDIAPLLSRHPYDLSGGELQKSAFVKVLIKSPKILFLDEPTKGLDALFKQEFADILCKLSSEGMSIIIATHDLEFAAKHSDKCALFFDGQIISGDYTGTFFTGNSFYTTAAGKMAQGICPGVITEEDLYDLCH